MVVRVLVLALVATCQVQAIGLTAIASVTTIAVNAKTIVSWARHPKKSVKTLGTNVKQVVTGKEKK